jgi:MoxR-like ATPase
MTKDHPITSQDGKEPASVELKEADHTFRHIFEPEHHEAIEVALATQRPLLLKGEPGIGKSQLARAAAKNMGRVFLSKMLHARTEPEDLLYDYDTVARLAEAQAIGSLGAEAAGHVSERLAEWRFVHPGPLWWAFHWELAQDHLRRLRAPVTTGGESGDSDLEKGDGDHGKSPPPCPFQVDASDPKKGVVLLLDEIDKAESAVPNGLLEALGNRRFSVPRTERSVEMKNPFPLVIVTTNDERQLPDAFVRRCWVLPMKLEDTPEMRSKLLERGQAHANGRCQVSILNELIENLMTAREKTPRSLRKPGQAEYLDLVRALCTCRPDNEKGQRELLANIQKLALEKHGPLDAG